jgi:eukaryotic-like serine/threonine-protein kinase
MEKSTWSFDEGEPIGAGRFAVSLLGGGRRYEAYLAFDDHLRSLVVVKVVRPDLVEEPAALRGLAAEAHALACLAHPMLPRLFGAELDGPRPHVALDLVDGPRLSTLIRRYEVNIEQLLPLAVNVCAVLHYMGREGWLHMDVKPSNIIMGPQPRLIDLSVARPLHELPDLRRPVGTDAHMAPEQCDPARFGDIGPAADVWGLGVTLYEALAKRRPFTPESDERFPQLAQAPAPLPDSVPQEVASLVMSCLHARPSERPAAGDLSEALEPLAAGLPAPRIGRFRPGAEKLTESLEAR